MNFLNFFILMIVFDFFSGTGSSTQAFKDAGHTVISFEPLLIKAAGQEVTLLHAGRSSQDMHATYRAAILREDMLALAEQLNTSSGSLLRLAERHTKTIVPNYTNGVAAQPNSYAHYLLGHAAGLERDACDQP